MEKVVWKGILYPGKLEEYRRRHAELWPEMRRMFAEAGIRNYTIWNSGRELFGYYECADRRYADAVKAASPVMKRWSESMQDLMQLQTEPAAPPFSMVFSLEEACAPCQQDTDFEP